jgi:hypothetical protein
MQFMMMNFEDEETRAERNDAAKAPAYWGAWTGYVQALREAGVMLNGNGLQPPEAGATLRLRDGRRQVNDGPFADTKEQLGGYFIIEVPDLDAALEWAARCPAAAKGAVELRPVLPPMNG